MKLGGRGTYYCSNCQGSWFFFSELDYNVLALMKIIHLQALAVWAIYSFGTKFLFFKGLVIERSYSWILISLISAFFGIFFLYLFSHKDFFEFVKLIEKKEIKKEKKLLKVFSRTGKLLTVIIIGFISGPMLAALTARILLKPSNLRYFLVFVVSLTSTIVWLGIAKGTISFF